MSETELKLLLPGADPQRVAEQLARHPLLRRRSRAVQTLYNVYYDTPDQALRQQKVALRVRRVRADGAVESPANERWVLTLKTAGTSVGGLSQRGEWEADLPDGTPRRQSLLGTPWDALDPDGRLWPQLLPCFVTTCTRTLWQVRQRDRSHIEMALDVGEIVAGGRQLPVCELELELIQGPVEALHALARGLAEHLPVWPGQASKAERGYALARDEAHRPATARAPLLHPQMPWHEAAALALSESWDQALRNLALWCQADTPEALHQARVGWRRLRSLARLWGPALPAPPDVPALRGVWRASATVRELDVLLTETLPAWAPGYLAGGPEAARQWGQMQATVAAERARAAAELRACLTQPATGLDGLAWGMWLGGLTGALSGALPSMQGLPWPVWVTRRLRRVKRRMRRMEQASSEAQRHATRLLAKRVRYGTEALLGVLPKRRARRWLKQSTQAQAGEGARRDLVQAVAWLDRLPVPDGPRAYLRGVCQGVLSR